MAGCHRLGTAVIAGASGLALGLLLAAGPAWADGLAWESLDARDLVAEKAQQAWIEWEGGRERLVVAVRPERVSPGLAWLLPVPVPARQATLSLVNQLPHWAGEEVRAKAHLAARPGLLALYFCATLLLTAGRGAGCAVLAIIVLMSSISIGPGPESPVVQDVETLGRVELGGLVSELAEAESVAALERYLRGKSTALPAQARTMIAEHIRAGGSFVVSWARKDKLAPSLAVEVEFPAAKPWYPVRLTSAYGKAKTPIDLRVAGWRAPAGLPDRARVGYYDGSKHTRVVYSGRAKDLAADWIFDPMARTLSLRLAALVGDHPFLANILLLLACSALGGLLLGPLFLPELRGAGGLARAAALGASGILPFAGPLAALGSYFPESLAAKPPPSPAPAPMDADPRWRWAAVATLAGAALQILGIVLESLAVYLSGCLSCAGGLFAFYRFKHRTATGTAATAACLVSIFAVIGPVLALLSPPPAWSRPPEPRPHPLRWDLFVLSLSAASLLLHLAAGGRLMTLWPLDRATAVIGSSGHGFASLIRKSSEGATRGNLGAIRSALSRYHEDTSGGFPAHLAALTAGGKYLERIPVAKTPNLHQDSDQVLLLAGAQLEDEAFDDSGGWAYVIDGPRRGEVLVNCTHTDSKGSLWRSY